MFKKLISLFVIVCILLCNLSVLARSDMPSAASDETPYIYMVELVDETELMHVSEGTTARSKEAKIEADAEAEPIIDYEQRVKKKTEDARKTDRYIVKYKDSRGKAEFASRLGKNLAHSEKVFKNKQQPKKNGVQEADSEYDLIVLSEKKSPVQFADELSALDMDDAIAYIQPDFPLSPDSLGLDIAESEGKADTDTDSQEQNSSDEQSPDQEDSEESADPTDEDDSEEISGDQDKNTEEISEDEDENTEGEPDQLESAPVIVAVIDSGADVSHELIQDYVWTSPEDGGHGWNFVSDTNEIYSSDYPLDYAHGTHISGIIAQSARDNQADVEIMNLKVFRNGMAYTSDVIRAIEYASLHGARVINCSFGGTQYNPALYEAIASLDALFICAVGNNRMNLAETPMYPACFELDNIISVSSVNADGGFSYFSNFSTDYTDISALGRDVLSSLPEGHSDTYSGTSVATAMVSASAAVVKNRSNELTMTEIKNRLLDSADRLSNLENKVADGRRLNPENALLNISGEYLTLTPEEDFDVHSYAPSPEESLRLFSSLTPSKISAGAKHSLILMNDGSVWAFGNGYNGSLGDGNVNPHIVPYTNPVQVIGLPSDVLYIYAGGYHNLAVTYSGHIYSWGDNTFGQLGRSSSGNAVAMQITSLGDIYSASAGESHSLATYLYEDHYEMTTYTNTYFWGDNSQGQLGIPGYTTITYPHSYISTVNNITLYGTGGYAGKDFTFIHALTEQGSYPALLYGSGNNTTGQLGNGTTISRQQFGRINASSIRAVGGAHAGYINGVNGDVYVWGANDYGQAGGSAGGYKTTPQRIYEASSVYTQATGLFMGESHTIIQLIDNSLLSFGRNDLKQLSFGSLQPDKIAAGYNHNLAIQNGIVWVWGSNTDNQIANTTVTSYDPIQVTLPDEITLNVDIENSVMESMVISGVITGTTENGPIDLSGANITVESKDPFIADAWVGISAGQAILSIEGIWEGITEIEVTVSGEGIIGSLTIPIEVTPYLPTIVALSTNISNTITKNQTATSEINITIDGEPADLTDGLTTVTAVSDDSLVAEASAQIIEGQAILTVTGVSAGSTTIDITADYIGYTETISVPIEVLEDQSVPTGLTGVAPTSSANNDGIISGTTAEMEYRLSTDMEYIAVTGTQITGLVPGTYYVRYAARPGYNAGADATIVVPEYSAKIHGTVTWTTTVSEVDSELNTTVNLKPSYQSDTIIASCSVNPETNTFEFSNINNGNYILEMKRTGYLTRYVPITVSGIDINLPDKNLIVGDINNDLQIDMTDRNIATELKSIMETALQANSGKTSASYNDTEIISNDNSPTTNQYKISGFVQSAGEYLAFGLPEVDNMLTSMWKTSVTLKTINNGTVVASGFVNPATGGFEFINIPNGSYRLEIKRSLYLSRFITITVNNGNVVLTDKSLLFGDVNNDQVINNTDKQLMDLAYLGALFSLSSNLGKDVTTYNENISFASNQAQAAPTGLLGVAPATPDNNDGKITGVTSAMEYKLSTASTYTRVFGTEITGLSPGTYKVRYAEKFGYNAGEDAVVVVSECSQYFIPEYEGIEDGGDCFTEAVYVNQDQPAPTGLYAVMPTTAENNDGIIAGTTVEMEYRLSTDTEYMVVTGEQITGLVPGTYYVRYAARTGYNAGADAVVVVAEYSQYFFPEYEGIEDGGDCFTEAVYVNQDQPAPTGLYAVMPTTAENNDGIIAGTTAEMEYRMSTASVYTAVTGEQIPGLVPGTYYVRYAARTGYNAGADTVIVVAEYGASSNEIEISAETGKDYLIYISADNVGVFDDTYVLSYDSSVFDVVDLCGIADGEQTAVGSILGTEITISEVSSGTIKFSVSKDIPDGMLWSGIINTVKLRAKATGITTVLISKE